MSLTDRRRKPKTHHYVMEPEDSRTKAAEFNRYFKVLSQELRSWLQTAMAENVNIEIRGSGPSVQEFFKVLDKGKDADSSSDKP